MGKQHDCLLATLRPVDSGVLITIGRFHSPRGTHEFDPHGAPVIMRLILMMIPVGLVLHSYGHKSAPSGSE